MAKPGSGRIAQSMAYQVLARKYRPQRFADVAGQEHVTVTLMNALRQNRIAHGYIFSGHRGIGKTTIARILACALNCRNPIGSEVRPTPEPCEVCDSCLEIRAGNSVDMIEIDAATNRGIDEIRELRDAARYAPSRDRYKIYLLDEAHQITDAAFNALLKTLEEPPEHIVFMMATTQPEDIPQTVRSRCQHFSFHAVKLVDILGELRGIAEHEGVDADEVALSLLAEAGDGSMRDALSIMDQAIASAPLEEGKARLDAAQIRELMGAVPNATFERIFEAVNENNSAQVMTVANDLLDAGNSPAQLARQAVRYLRSCVIAKITGLTAEGGESTELLQISPEEQRRAARTAALFSEEELTRFLQTMLRTFDELGYRQEQRFHFELGLLKLVHLRRLLPMEEVLSSIPRAGAGAARASAPGPVGVARPVNAAVRATPASQPAVAAKPAFSPFEQSQTRRKFDNVQGSYNAGANALAPVQAAAAPVAAPVLKPEPVMVAPVAPAVAAIAIAEPVISMAAAAEVEDGPPIEAYELDGSTDYAPEPEAAAPLTATAATGGREAVLQRVAVEALQAAGQSSAADAMEDARFAVADGGVTIQTQLSKTLLPVAMNPEAERILRNGLRGEGIHKVTLLAGASQAVAAAAKKPRAAKAGSAQAKAMEHPMVREAQRLFEAEIQTVIDLSDSE